MRQAFLIILGLVLLLPGACFAMFAREIDGFGLIAAAIFLVAGGLIWIGITRR